MWWDIFSGTVKAMEELHNGGILLSLQVKHQIRQFLFVDDDLRKKLYGGCCIESLSNYTLVKYFNTIDTNEYTLGKLNEALSNDNIVYVGIFECLRIQFLRVICSTFPIHQCILNYMFEYPKENQIFKSLENVASLIIGHEDEYDGHLLFLDKKGEYIGHYPSVEALLQDHTNHGLISNDPLQYASELLGESFPFYKEELVVTQLTLHS